MKTKTKKIKFVEEFRVGNHSIGYLDPSFLTEFENHQLTDRPAPTFKTLRKRMNNADMIERELNPGRCELGDILAFLKNPPEGTKDGWANLFLVGDKVVSVSWWYDDSRWRVDVWLRGLDWFDAGRVFSPGLETSVPSASSLESSESLPLELIINGIRYKKV